MTQRVYHESSEDQPVGFSNGQSRRVGGFASKKWKAPLVSAFRVLLLYKTLIIWGIKNGGDLTKAKPKTESKG
jgi:hypothetical protein